ncbi:MAG: AAA family ATPase [Alphaproteobacteria bacterium]|nr:AAA family ATPase [Alphaproteobacteria bacterium]
MTKASFLATYGPPLLQAGYPIIPIKPNTKYPGFDGWQKTVANENLLQGWLSNGFIRGGVGVLTREIPAVDLDVQDPEIVDKLIEWCKSKIGRTVQRVGKPPKQLLVYRTDEPFSKIASKKYVDFLGLEHKVEILGDGQQFVAFATHPDTGKPYEWVSEHNLAETAISDLPTISADQAQELVDYFETIIPDDWELVDNARTSLKVDKSIPAAERILAHAKPKADVTYTQLERSLTYLDPDMRMHDWVRIGMALYHQCDGDDAGFALWDSWSSEGVKYEPNTMRGRWRSFDADLRGTNPVTAATILQLAKREYQKRTRPKQTKFHLIHAHEVLAKLGPINWRIKDFLEEDTTGLIFGDPGSFKSFIALDMAFHVAAGKDWHGHAVKQGPVIYIAGEGHGGLARRFAAWERHHGVQLADLPIYASAQAAQFYDAESAADVVEAVQAITRKAPEPALIVIDTLARNFGGGDENSNTDMGVFLNHVDGLLRARFGATVMIVHHTGHSHKERARGATALKGGMDFEYRVDKTEMGMTACLSCTKMKDAKEPAATWFEGREIIVGGFDDDEMTSLVFDACAAPVVEEKPLKGKQAALYDLIAQEAPIDRDTLRNLVLAEGDFENADQFKRSLQELKKKELVVENDGWLNTVDGFFGPEGENDD